MKVTIRCTAESCDTVKASSCCAVAPVDGLNDKQGKPKISEWGSGAARVENFAKEQNDAHNIPRK